MELMNKKWLFMGDAPNWVEKKVVEEHPELDCDILKAGHHGSDTSSSLLFLKAVTPEVAILSCGLNNSYGHPHISVLNRLKSLGIKIRRTDEEGTISYLTLRGFGL
jgi:competence protein ComEC